MKTTPTTKARKELNAPGRKVNASSTRIQSFDKRVTIAPKSKFTPDKYKIKYTMNPDSNKIKNNGGESRGYQSSYFPILPVIIPWTFGKLKRRELLKLAGQRGYQTYTVCCALPPKEFKT